MRAGRSREKEEIEKDRVEGHNRLLAPRGREKMGFPRPPICLVGESRSGKRD